MSRGVLFAIIGVLIVGFIAYAVIEERNEGPLEKAAESVEDAADDISDDMEDAADEMEDAARDLDDDHSRGGAR